MSTAQTEPTKHINLAYPRCSLFNSRRTRLFSMHVALSQIRTRTGQGGDPIEISEEEFEQRKIGTVIAKKVCELTGISFTEMLNTKSRKRPIIMTRNLAVYFMRKHTRLCLRSISLLLCESVPYHHSTMIHNYACCKDDIDAMTEKENFYSNYLKLKRIFEEEFTTIETI